MPNVPSTIRPVDPDGNPIPRGLFARNRGIVACGRGLVYGPANAPPPCACGDGETVMGACCINGACSQLSSAACAAAGGLFIGGPCSENACTPTPPSCCAAGYKCFYRADSVITWSWSLTFDAYERDPNTGRCVHIGTAYNSQSGTTAQGLAGCSSGISFLAHAELPYPYSTTGLQFQVSFVAGSLGYTTDEPHFRVGTTAVFPASCGGGTLSYQHPDQDCGAGSFSKGYRNIRLTVVVSITGANRCSLQPELGRCCTSGVGDGCREGWTLAQCLSAGSDDWLPGATCSSDPCPTGACCIAGECSDGYTESNCLNASGQWFGAGSVCSSFPCIPPPPCCSGNTCRSCSIPAGVTVPWSIDLAAEADVYTAQSGACVFREHLTNRHIGTGNLFSGGCEYETDIISTSLFSSIAIPGSLVVGAQFRSCEAGTNRGPHVVVSAAGIVSKHDVLCAGGTIEVMRPAGFGMNCPDSGKHWRNIRIVVSVSMPASRACPGIFGRASRRILMPGVDFATRRAPSGCSGCGGGPLVGGGALL